MPARVCVLHGELHLPHPPKQDCDGCWSAYGHWRAQQDRKHAVQSKGGVKGGGGRQSKVKGRAGCVAVQEALLAAAPWLSDADIYVKATSQIGVDLHLSPRARAWFGFSIEGKNSEKLNIWKALKQATDNASPGLPPIVIFKRARTELFAALRLTDFLKLLPCPENAPAPLLLPTPQTDPTSPT